MEYKNENFDAAGWKVSSKCGVTKAQILKTLEWLPEDEELISFQVDRNQSLVVGFITCAAGEQGELEIRTLLEEICEDCSKEREDRVYTTISGLQIFVDCDSESNIVPSLVTCQAEGCVDGQVDGEQCDFCAGTSLVSEGEPGSESYDLMNEISIDESGIFDVNHKDFLFEGLGVLMASTDERTLKHIIRAIGTKNIKNNLQLLWSGFFRVYSNYYPEETARSIFNTMTDKLGLGSAVIHVTCKCDACGHRFHINETEEFEGIVNGEDFDGQVCIPCYEQLKTGTYDNK
ncbi:hypothetical protein MHB77_31590 [Paenibacillus sp. FSL K6-3166]|uniref:hypothetical protein n=1 Tax=Paenibacillus sp. FSL K6-3166 TaxID=2921492 RepID=UPI0030F5E2A6